LRSVHPSYKKTILLGNKEGISGSVVGGYNVGINSYISDSKKVLSIKALKFMTSREMQKKLMIETKTLSAIDDLYDDTEVCSVVDCNLIKNIQFFFHNHNEYYDNKFLDYINEFMYGDKTAVEVLEQISNINKFYYISINPKISMPGFVVFIIIIVLSLLMLFSLGFLFIDKFKQYFKFLSIDLWIINFFGNIFNMFSLFTMYGFPNNIKCHVQFVLVSLCTTLYLTPILFKLIAIYPRKNTLFSYIKDHKYLFILIFILFDIMMSIFYFITPYTIVEVIVPKEKNYKFCRMNEKEGFLPILFLLFEKCFVVLLIELLLFMEWNIKKTTNDIKAINSAITIDTLYVLLLMIICILNIKNFVVEFILYSILSISVSLTNFILVYASKILWVTKEMNEKQMFFEKAMKEIHSSNSMDDGPYERRGSVISNNRRASVYSTRRASVISKIITCHYCPDSEFDIDKDIHRAHNPDNTGSGSKIET